MASDPIAVPAPRIPPIATDMSSTSKSIAAVLFVVAFLFGVASVAAPLEEPPGGNSPSYDAGYVVGQFIAMFLMVGVPGWFGFRAARNAARATRAAALAAKDPSYSWSLGGKWIIAVDGGGVPRPKLSFKISGKLRTMLLAVPRAEVRES